MGSKPSKARRQTTPVATEAATVPMVSKTPQDPKIPNEIIDEILNHLIANSGSWNDPPVQRSLRSCSLVSKSWVPSCRRHLFHIIIFTSRKIARWLETFPVPEESPAYYVKDLRFSLSAPEEFFQHTPWFTNAEKMTMRTDLAVTFPSLGISLFARLPQSVKSLAIKADDSDIDLMQTRDIMAYLPNLNDLILSGTVVARSEYGKALPGLGTTLRGRFCGEFRIMDGHISEYLVNMLLEVPTGLHFTKLYVHADHPCLFWTMRLAEACCKTLVNFLYSCLKKSKSHPFQSPGLTGSNVGTLTLSPERRFFGAFQAVPRLFQVPKAPNSDSQAPFGQGTSPLYPCGPLDPQTLDLPTPIPHPSQLHRSHPPKSHLQNLESGKPGQRSPTDRRRILPD